MPKTLSLLTHLIAFYGRAIRHPGRWRVVSSLVALFKLKPSGVHEVRAGGLRWLLDPSDHQQAGVFWLGEMDRWERFHLATALHSQAVFLDIGANFGYYSISLAKQTGAKVVAFEPQSAVAQKLLKHVEMNQLSDRIRVETMALSDAAGSVSMTSYEGNTGKTALSDAPGEVEVIRLDDWVKANPLERLDAIKMDVEGVEARVLRGGMDTIRRFRPKLLLEVNPFALARQGESAVKLASLLAEAGYRIYSIQRRSLVPLNQLDDSMAALNIFCVSGQV
jgi:FkbM family methyltransferase